MAKSTKDVAKRAGKAKKKRELVGKNQKKALAKLAERLDVSKKALQSTLMKTAFKNCRNTEEFVSAVIVANTYGLNPLLGEMYVFPSKGGGVTPIVGIDGWVKLVTSHQSFDGVELIENENEEGELVSVTAKFHLKDKSHPVVVTEYMEECRDPKKGPWQNWPRRMLRHKAYIQGARLAFGYSGIYDADEGKRIAAGQQIEIEAEEAKVNDEQIEDMGETEVSEEPQADADLADEGPEELQKQEEPSKETEKKSPPVEEPDEDEDEEELPEGFDV